MSDVVDRLERFAREGAGVAVLIGAATEIKQLREALKFARNRITYYGTIADRRHFDHDLAEIYPKIDAALNG
jgi:hypothetical protein